MMRHKHYDKWLHAMVCVGIAIAGALAVPAAFEQEIIDAWPGVLEEYPDLAESERNVVDKNRDYMATLNKCAELTRQFGELPARAPSIDELEREVLADYTNGVISEQELDRLMEQINSMDREGDPGE